MKYDPQTPLSEEEINRLDDDTLFEYLDSRVEYYKQFSRPLDTYHTKQFLAASKGGEITENELKTAKEIGSIGDTAKMTEIVETMEKLGGDPKLKDAGVRNVKTNRSQWFS